MRRGKRPTLRIAFAAAVTTLATVCLAAPTLAQQDLTMVGDLRGHRGAVLQVLYTPDGKHVISAGQDSTIRIWDPNKTLPLEVESVWRMIPGRSSITARNAARIEDLDLTSDGKFLAEATRLTRDVSVLRIRDPESGNRVRAIEDRLNDVRACAFSPDGKLIAVDSRLRRRPWQKILLFETETGKFVREITTDRLTANFLVFSKDGKQIVSAGGKRGYIFDVESGKLHHRLLGPDGAIRSLAISPDGKLVAAGSSDDKVSFWELESGDPAGYFQAHQEGVESVAFAANNKIIAVGGEDGTVKLFGVESKKQLRRLWGHTDDVLDLSFKPDMTQLASASADNTIGFWRIDMEELLHDEQQHLKDKD